MYKKTIITLAILFMCGVEISMADFNWFGLKKTTTEKNKIVKKDMINAEPYFILFRKDTGFIIKYGPQSTAKYDLNVIKIDGATISGLNWNYIGIGTSVGFNTNSIVTNDITDLQIIDLQAQEAQRLQMLNTVISIYTNFLKTEWTVVLQTKGIIPQSQEINITNTTTAQNMMYLMSLRTIDTTPNKPTYSYFKSELETARSNIERLGGDMSSLK